MEKLEIHYVQRPPRQPDDLPPGVAEIGIRIEENDIYIIIARNGFIASETVMEAVAEKVHQLVGALDGNHRPLAERIGLAPVLSAEWQEFLDHLLHQPESWAFVVPGTLTPA